MQLKRLFSTAVLAISAAAWASNALAQTAAAWPTRGPIKLVAVFPPGGSVDQVARILSVPLQTALGQTVIVEPRKSS